MLAGGFAALDLAHLGAGQGRDDLEHCVAIRAGNMEGLGAAAVGAVGEGGLEGLSPL